MHNCFLSYPRTRGRRRDTTTDTERATDCDIKCKGSVSVPDEVLELEGTADMESEMSLYIPEPTPVPSSCGSEGGEGSQHLEVLSEDGDKVEAPPAPQPDADEEGPVTPQYMDVLSEDGDKVEAPPGSPT